MAVTQSSGVSHAAFSQSSETRGLQVAQSRTYLDTLGLKVGIMSILEALGKAESRQSNEGSTSKVVSGRYGYKEALTLRPSITTNILVPYF